MSALPDDPIASVGATDSTPARAPDALPMRWLSAFGRFWWDFLVGDTPELFVGTVVAVGLVALLAHMHLYRAMLLVLLPVMVATMLGATVRRGRHG